MKDVLTQLISSMTGREKAYFRRFSNLFSDSEAKNYLKLYNFLAGEESTDVSLEQYLSGQPMARYLSSEKNYLLQKLLTSLAFFHLGHSADRKIIRLILFSELLLERGLRDKALKYLRQAKSLAYRFEEFSLVNKLIQVEEEILFREGILDFTQELAKLNQERRKIFEILSNLSELRLLREQARELQYVENYVTQPQRFPHIFENELIESIDNAKSIRATDHWFYIKELRFYLLRRFRDAQATSTVYVNFLNQYPHIFPAQKFQSALSNLLYFCALNRDSVQFEIALEQLQELRRKPTADNMYISFIIYARTLELYYRTDRHSEAFDKVGEIGRFVLENAVEMGVTQVNYTLFLLVRSCMEFLKFEEALDWMNTWKKSGVLEYTLIHNRLLTLIIYFELSWNQLLEAEVVSAYKNLRSHRIYDKLASALIGFFRKYLRQPNKKIEYLTELEGKLSLIKSNPELNKAFVYYDFHNWSKNYIRRSGTRHKA